MIQCHIFRIQHDKKNIKTSGVKCFIISLKITNFKEILGKCNKNSENRILWLLGT